MDELKFQEQFVAKKNQFLELVRKALEESGLEGVDISSITLYAKRGHKRTCPDGRPAVWEPIRMPDGTVVYGWVCK